MPAGRSTRVRTSSTKKPIASLKTKEATRKATKNTIPSKDDNGAEVSESSSSDDGGDAYEEPESALEEEDVQSLDSDALDDDEEEEGPAKSRKRKHGLAAKRANASPRKRRKAEEDLSDDLKEGQEVVGIVVQAPKTGRGAFGSRYQCCSFLTWHVQFPLARYRKTRLIFWRT